MDGSVKWISSLGGPFIVLPRWHANEWLGIDGLSVKMDEGCANDYERACQVRSYAGIIKCQSIDVLVLNDGPEDISWLAISASCGMIVKWLGADSDQQVLESLTTVELDRFTALDIEFFVTEAELVSFDSVLRFNGAIDNTIWNFS